jgi:peptide/nickel transport system substrate-binding protein
MRFDPLHPIRHCEECCAIARRDAAIHLSRRFEKDGLLRSARNDVVSRRAMTVAFVLCLLATPALAANCGTIIIPPGLGEGVGADVTSLNPLTGAVSLYNEEAYNMLFEQLLWINRYHVIDWQRSIASAVTTPDNGKTYNVTMRPWAWSDGQPVTANDVAYTLQLIKALGSTYPGYGSGGMPDLIAGLTVQDASHFTVTLKKPVNSNWFILNGLAQLLPLPAHIWSHYTLDQIWQNQSSPAFFAVDDGPLKIQTLNMGLEAIFVPNQSYAGGPMHFNRFIMKFMDNADAEMQAVESHDLDMSNIPFPLWSQAQHIPGFHVVTLPPSYSWHELIPNMLNNGSKFFADVRVRQALADAISQPEMINLAMHGQGIPVYGPVPPEPATFLSPQARAGDYAVGYDPAKAKALLAAAGFTPGPDGILRRHGTRLSFTLLVPAGQAMRIEMAESMQANLSAVGIEMKVHQVEFNQMMALMVGPPAGWQAILIGNDLSPYPSGEGSFVSGAYYNNNGYSDPTMDKYITQSTGAPGLDGLFAYENYASEQQPVIFLPVEKYAILARDGLEGITGFINPLGYWAPEKLYCDAAPQS